MIPAQFVKQWREFVPWRTLAQVEQDLMLSRVLVHLYSNQCVRDSLLFRGGTALNKLFLKPPARYSEDLDFVQRRPEPVGQIIDAIRGSLQSLLGEPQRSVTRHSAKLVYRYTSVENLPARIKIEINTTEHIQILPLCAIPFDVTSKWFSDAVTVYTHSIDELMASKLRALYQRRKGRDLFDIWYVAGQNLVDLDKVVEIFGEYCKREDACISKKEFIKNLELKRAHADYPTDMYALLPHDSNWHFENAYEYVLENVISRL